MIGRLIEGPIDRPIDRRAFLRAAGAGFATALLPRQAEALARSEAVFASASATRTPS